MDLSMKIDDLQPGYPLPDDGVAWGPVERVDFDPLAEPLPVPVERGRRVRAEQAPEPAPASPGRARRS